jgi:hypothetical protein
MPSNFTAFLNKAALSADVEQAAVADNCRFEERASDQRWAQFEEKLLPVGPVTWNDWTIRNKQHLQDRVHVLSSRVPDAFLAINRPAWKEDLPEDTVLVRIESLVLPLNKWRKGLDPSNLKIKFNALLELIKLADSGHYESAMTVAEFFEMWNKARDGRPVFAALHNEVQAECDIDDWPHALRDRLGIGAWSEKPVPVALMSYPLREVLAVKKAKRLPAACALPTVLDDGMHEFFFPTPASYSIGATLHLNPSNADVLTAEILHCRIEYERRHLLKIGYVSNQHRQNGDELRKARDLHLIALRAASGCHDFGEKLCGRASC